MMRSVHIPGDWYPEIQLEPHRRKRPLLPKPNQKGKPVTLVAGIVCEDGIVLASDTEITYGPSKIPDSPKISIARFKDGTQALIAEAGSIPLSRHAVQLIRERAPDVDISTDDSVAQFVKSVVREVRADQQTLFPGPNTLEEWRSFFKHEDHYFKLTVAYYYNDAPQLYTIDTVFSVLEKANATGYYTASGSGDQLGNYLLREHTLPGMFSGIVVGLAAYIVDTVKIYAQGVGSKTQMGLIYQKETTGAEITNPAAIAVGAPDILKYSDNQTMIFSDAYIEKITLRTRRIYQEAMVHRDTKLYEALDAEVKETAAEIERLFKAWKGGPNATG